MVLLAISRQHEGGPGAGQWKDLRSLERLLNAAGEIRRVDFDQGDWSPVLEAVDSATRHVIVYYSFWPELVAALRERHPRIDVIVRAVNPEALQNWHRIDWFRQSLVTTARQVYGCLRLLLRDRACARAAHSILCISSWDLRQYWRRLGGSAQLYDVPYYSHFPFLEGVARPSRWEGRDSVVLCLAGGRDRIGRSQMRNFEQLARSCITSQGSRALRFQATPGLRPAPSPESSQWIEHVAAIADPWERLCRVRAVALLSPLGYGAKTTLVDAIAAGCHVIVHPALLARLPECLRSACIPWRPAARRDVAHLVSTLLQPPSPQQINATLEAAAQRGIRAALRD